ncbi:MAG: transporter substrate-binding domain-containing protein [Desulfobacterales bacterium]|nr:transporter substrate-binding domain-containing protein [Desulfobacterales bacterium]
MLKKTLIVIVTVLYLSPEVFAENKTIIISTTNWAPYTDKKLKNGGFLSEICMEAFKKAGYNTKILFVPWRRAVKMTKEGYFHALIGASYTKKRIEYFSYPRYNWKSSVHFFARKGHKFKFNKIKDLCPLRIGIFAGSFYIKRFKSYNCFNIEAVPTTQQNIKKLVLNRIDLFLDFKDSVNFYLNKELKEYASQVEPVYPALETDKIYLVISKKTKKLYKSKR